MSVNFGYGGYGMMNGMGMAGGMGMGVNSQATGSQYSCPMCYQHGAVPYNYQCYVNPLPKQVTNPSFFSKVMKKLMGG